MNKQFSIPSKFYSNEDSIQMVNNPNFHPVKLRIMSTGKNWNGSDFIIDSFDTAKDTVSYAPILANIIEREDGELDTNGHDIDWEMKCDYQGNVSFKETYIEKPVGVFLANACEKKYDADNDVYYLESIGYVWKQYSDIYEILKRDEVKDVSVEIEVEDGDFRDDGYYEIRKFNVLGCTILGNGNMPAIDNSRIEFNFSKNNEYKEKVKELDELLKSFNLKGGDNMDNEVEKNVEPQEEFTEDDAVEIPVIIEEQPQEFAEEEQDEDNEEVCPKCGKPLDECVCDENDDEEEMACGNKKKKKKCSCEDEKIYSQSELDEAVSNAKAEFSDVLKELAELREFKAEYDRQVELARLNESMDELVANFNVNEEKVNELREKVINGDYSLEKFELELYRNNQVVTKKDFSKEDKKTLPIIDVEDKKSEVDKLFDFYGIPKRDK